MKKDLDCVVTDSTEVIGSVDLMARIENAARAKCQRDFPLQKWPPSNQNRADFYRHTAKIYIMAAFPELFHEQEKEPLSENEPAPHHEQYTYL